MRHANDSFSEKPTLMRDKTGSRTPWSRLWLQIDADDVTVCVHHLGHSARQHDRRLVPVGRLTRRVGKLVDPEPFGERAAHTRGHVPRLDRGDLREVGFLEAVIDDEADVVHRLWG